MRPRTKLWMPHLCFMSWNTFRFIFIQILLDLIYVNKLWMSDERDVFRVHSKSWFEFVLCSFLMQNILHNSNQLRRKQMMLANNNMRSGDGREPRLPWSVFKTITYLRSLDSDDRRVILVDRVHAEWDPYWRDPSRIYRLGEKFSSFLGPDILMRDWMG